MKTLTASIDSHTPSGRLAFGLKEAAELLGVSASFLRLEIGRGRLQSTRLGRRLVLTGEELHRYLARGQEGQRDG